MDPFESLLRPTLFELPFREQLHFRVGQSPVEAAVRMYRSERASVCVIHYSSDHLPKLDSSFEKMIDEIGGRLFVRLNHWEPEPGRSLPVVLECLGSEVFVLRRRNNPQDFSDRHSVRTPVPEARAFDPTADTFRVNSRFIAQNSILSQFLPPGESLESLVFPKFMIADPLAESAPPKESRVETSRENLEDKEERGVSSTRTDDSEREGIELELRVAHPMPQDPIEREDFFDSFEEEYNSDRYRSRRFDFRPRGPDFGM